MGMSMSPEQARKLARGSGQLRPRVTLPAPPSANHLFATANGKRVKSREYKAWLAEAVPALAFLAAPVVYPCRYRIVVAGAVNMQRDGENTLKPTLDAAVTAGVIPDDSLTYVRGGSWEFEPGTGSPTITLSFE